MAPDGHAAVLWARSPGVSGTPLELATAPPGGRFGRPQVIGTAPFGILTVGLAIADSGAVVVAVGPDTGGLYVIHRSPSGRVATPEHLVNRRQLIAALSLAVGSDGAMLLAWESQPRAATGTGPNVVRAAWLRARQAVFDRPLVIATADNPRLDKALIVAAGRAAVGWTATGSPNGPQRALLAFGGAGKFFKKPISFATTTGALLGDRLTPDGEGGAFAAVIKGALSSSTVALTARDIHADGTIGPVSPITAGKLDPIQLTHIGAGHALLSWAERTHTVRAAVLGLASARHVPGSISLSGDYSLSVDPRGAGVIALAHGLRPTAAEPIPTWRLSYRLISAKALSGSGLRAIGTSLGDPAQTAIDNQGRGLILWVGPRAARAPVEVLRVRAS